MTNDQMQAIKDDIAYMRALAEEGRRAPLFGGSVLVAAGLIYGTAALIHWAVVADVLSLPPIAFSFLWLAAVALFFAALFTLKRRYPHRPGAHAANNRAYSIAWSGLGAACFGIALSLIVAAIRTRDPIFMGLFPPAILSLYGGSWLVAAPLSDRPWLRWVGFASLAVGVGSAWLIGTDAQWLVYAAALFLLAALPGWLLMRHEPSEVV